ncbi:MAG: HIG1 domain-containing protein [Rhodospirillales bacterium]|nr:HIG1 domain-containing protein [Rhodospirillales bacterium]
MNSILPVLLGIAMLATVVILVAGIIAFAFNSGLNAKYSHTLMKARVVCQGVAIALFGAIMLLHLA